MRPFFHFIILTVLAAALLSGCATVLPSEYGPTARDSELSGPVVALAGDGDIIAAANREGVFIKADDGEWKQWEVPGITDYSKVTALAVRNGEICVGTDGEGLHIYSDGTWEVRTVRYEGLPDDTVLSLAFDGEEEGLPGDNLWVGTRDGIAVRRSGTWSVYEPGENWLTGIVEEDTGDSGKIYIESGYNLGGKGEDSKYFNPPVTAIGVGPDRVVFASPESGIAIVTPLGTATVYFTADAEISSLLVEEGIIWVGTNGGLVWGGLEGVAEGTPWPAHRLDVQWSGRLFDTKNSEPFLYRWHLVGYNMATVPDIKLSGDSLWVVYGKPDKNTPVLTGEGGENEVLNMGVRRYFSIKDYISRKKIFVYESYGKKAGISGHPLTVLPLPERGELWIGTSKGLYRLEK